MPGYMMKDKKKKKTMYGYGGEVGMKKKKKVMYKDGKEVPELTKAQMSLPKNLRDQIIRSKKKKMDNKKG
tara:strand:+ start:8 stop:217 length:210 start_codon:yes stop_codon:yes gene_type:complete